MKVITIKEPYATLIAEGLKEYEFRTWKTKYRGDILIHAAKTPNNENKKRFIDRDLKYKEGYIIAKATLTDCVEVDDKLIKELLDKDKEVYKNLSIKRDKKLFGFKLENVERIEPIEAKGKLSLWDYDYSC
jgi:hypothetical protein